MNGYAPVLFSSLVHHHRVGRLRVLVRVVSLLNNDDGNVDNTKWVCTTMYVCMYVVSEEKFLYKYVCIY